MLLRTSDIAMHPDSRPISVAPTETFCVHSSYHPTPSPCVAESPLSLDSVAVITPESPSADAAKTHAEQVALVQSLIDTWSRRLLEHMSSQLWAARSQPASVQVHEICKSCMTKLDLAGPNTVVEGRQLQRPYKGNDEDEAWYTDAAEGKIVYNVTRRGHCHANGAAPTLPRTSPGGSPLWDREAAADSPVFFNSARPRNSPLNSPRWGTEDTECANGPGFFPSGRRDRGHAYGSAGCSSGDYPSESPRSPGRNGALPRRSWSRDMVEQAARSRADTALACPFEAIANTKSKMHARANTLGDSYLGSTAKGMLIPDAADLKIKVQQSIEASVELNFCDLYHTTGLAQSIARSPTFEAMTLGIIVCNALWISIEQDHNESEILMEAALPFQVAEHVFCLFFSAEWLIKFFALSRKRYLVKDKWFVFDTFLVAAMVCETWVMGVLMHAITGSSAGLGNLAMVKVVRLLRLTRMVRIVRLLRAFPELILLIKAIGVAIRAVFFISFLLLIITYMFAIALTQMTQNSEVGAKYFDTVPDSMKYMLISSVFPDLTDILEAIGFSSWFWLMVFLTFLFTISLTLMNMLVGFLVEVVKLVSESENQQMVTQMFTEEMTQILSELDDNQRRCLTGPEFTKIFWHSRAVRFLTNMDVDVVALVGHVEILFKGEKALGYADIIRWLLELRGTNVCTVKDIVELRKYILEELRNETETIRELLHKELESRGHYFVPRRR